jgi:hypothetical protein
MSQTRTITTETQAWLQMGRDPQDLTGNPERAINVLTFDSDGEYLKAIGYTFVGTATITVQVADERAIVESKVASLRAQKAKVIGDAHAEATAIESRIQKLLAIGYAGEVA